MSELRQTSNRENLELQLREKRELDLQTISKNQKETEEKPKIIIKEVVDTLETVDTVGDVDTLDTVSTVDTVGIINNEIIDTNNKKKKTLTWFDEKNKDSLLSEILSDFDNIKITILALEDKIKKLRLP